MMNYSSLINLYNFEYFNIIIILKNTKLYRLIYVMLCLALIYQNA